MIPVLAAIVAAGIAIPHALRLRRVSPVAAAAIWLSSLALRALAGVLAVVYLLFTLPRTDLFIALTHWCLEVALPAPAAGLSVEGHSLGDVALYVPGAVLAGSLVLMCIRTARDARRARRAVEENGLGTGPRDSVIVGGPEVMFAVAGLARPRVIVSAGALVVLDDDELAAALDHERAHIVRRHRFVMLLAVALASLGRAVPGTERAIRELALHLERDADRWALRRHNDRLALASVICKAATAAGAPPPAVAALAAIGVRERLTQLLEERPARAARALNGVAAIMVACTLLLGGLVPAAAVAAAGADAHRAHHGHHCKH